MHIDPARYEVRDTRQESPSSIAWFKSHRRRPLPACNIRLVCPSTKPLSIPLPLC